MDERTKFKKASFPYKTTISEAKVKTNRMVTTKWAYHREQRTLIFVLFLSAEVLFDGAFPL